MHSYRNKIQSYLCTFLELQLLLSLCLLPIFIAWGLPISVANFFGNLIFAPFLSSFIFISTLLIFTEIFHIPNQWLATSLNYITKLWSWLLSHGSSKFLIGFSKTTLIPSFFIIAIIAYVYFVSKFKRLQRLTILIILYCIPMIYQQYCTQPTTHAYLHSGKQKIEIITKNNKIIVYDTGALGARKSYESWIDFTLLPYIIQQTGATHIDVLITHKTNPRYQQALAYLQKAITIKHHIMLHQQPKLQLDQQNQN